jgi:hypothetical protein
VAWRNWIKEFFPAAYDHIVILYLPNKDRQSIEFDIEPWETKALEIMGLLFGGATSYPSRGSYKKIDAKGNTEADIIKEKTRMVVSFVCEDDFTEQNIRNITDLLKMFGTETNQESVAFVIDGEMYYMYL